MNARETIVLALKPFSHLPERDASYVIGTLKENGFTIMSKEDVEAVREKALDEAAKAVEQTYGINAAAIRSLKSKEGKIDS